MVAACLDQGAFAHRLYYIQDGLYSTRALVADKGWVIEEQTYYDVYGRARTWTSGDADADGDIEGDAGGDDRDEFFANFGKSECDAGYNWRCDVDNSGGVGTTDWPAFNRNGSTPANQQSYFTNPYYFTGRRVDFLDDGELTLQHNRHRSYDYYTGRWLTHDPLGIDPAGAKQNLFLVLLQYADGPSLYQYVRSGPVIYVDPWGYGEYKTVIVVVPPPNTSYAPAIFQSATTYDTWPRTWANLATRLNITGRTWATIAGGYAAGRPHAAGHLKHFAWNTGKPLDIGYGDLINQDAAAMGHYLKELTDAVDYVEQNRPFGKMVVTITDYSGSSSTPDWAFAVGGYRTWAEGKEIKCNEEGQIEMTWSIHFRDMYDWRLGSTAKGGLVTDGEMAEMHRWGEMQQYWMTGSYKVRLKWPCGDTSAIVVEPCE